MKDIRIKINGTNSYVFLEDDTIGISGENLQGKIIFEFTESTFVDGIGYLETKLTDGTKGYLLMDKVGETYQLDIKSSLLAQKGLITLQLRITQVQNEEEIPVFKSKAFFLNVLEAINATETVPDEYPEWIDVANTKLMEIDNLDIDIENNVVTIRRKDGTTKSENVKGDNYEITEEDYGKIEQDVKADIQPILENIENTANNAEVIAKGKSASVVKDTWAEMEAWLKDVANKGTHKTGDNLYIKAKYTDETKTERQPDYWIAEVLEEPNAKGYYYEISELEADKPDLDAYAKKEQFVTLSQDEYDTLEVKSANTYYFIIEEE